MNIRRVFRGISAKLLQDFAITREINHDGARGASRENSLKKFLQDGRLPGRYEIGTGEIISPNNDISKQCDLIVFDRLEGVPLLYDEATQIYPIDCVYGTIEVKSRLSKAELITSLENIRSVKELGIEQPITIRRGGMMTQMPRSKPFGIVFAYTLANNSLESLAENLREWETNVSPDFWPNMVVVLDTGIISHIDSSGNKLIHSGEIKSGSRAIGLHWKSDTLFMFYSKLLEICSRMAVSPVGLSSYWDRPMRHGAHVVRHHDRIVKQGEREKTYRLTSAFVEQVVAWCKAKGTISNEEFFNQTLGAAPQNKTPEFLARQVYFYDPDDLLLDDNENQA